MRTDAFWVRFAVLGLVFMVALAGCQKPQKAEKDYDRQLAAGEDALVKITDPAQIPDFTIACMDTYKLNEAVMNSLSYLSKPSSRAFFPLNGITHERNVRSLEAMAEMLDRGLRGRALNAEIQRRFDVYTSVGYNGEGDVLFTGYYTPIFDGALEQGGRYQYPLYRQPDDLVKGANGVILGRRTAAGVQSYPARAEIERSGMLKGEELVWLADPFEAYIAHVQGSAKIRLPNGKLMDVGYAATNGHEYKSVGQAMIADGAIGKGEMSLAAMIDYFKRNPGQIDRYINRNPRFVFFREDSSGPRGSLNEPVISMRTIATDKSIYPRASLTFISAPLPRLAGDTPVTRHYTGFFLDQDTGGAIRAPGRCDVYMGVGEQAGKLAGQTYQEGRLYYLFVKE